MKLNKTSLHQNRNTSKNSLGRSIRGQCRQGELQHDRNLRLAWISRSCAEQIYWRNARGHCVIIKYVILTLLAWMSLHVTSQQTTPSEVHARDFAWPPVVATFLSNFQSCNFLRRSLLHCFGREWNFWCILTNIQSWVYRSKQADL